MISEKKITTAKKPLRSLMRDVDMGRFAIPKLQREFVWDGPKAAKLLDSIYQGMPIGVMLIWETPKNQRLYLRQRYHVLPPFDPKNPTVWFIIDGQQRISVLHNLRDGKIIRNARGKEIDFSRVVFSLDRESGGQKIRYRKPIPGRYLSLSQIIHPHWRYKLGRLSAKKWTALKECREKILHYQLHFMFVQMKIEGIRECFLRINTQGMKVTTADAIFTQAEELDLRDFVHEVRQHLDDSFNKIPDMPILWAIVSTKEGTKPGGAAVNLSMKKIENETNNDRRKRKQLARDWTSLGVCFGKAVDYLRQNFKVLNKEFLYSDYMISILALFFFWKKGGPDTKQGEQIRKWFWATMVGGRYTGLNFSRCIPEDAKFFKRLARNPNARFKFSQPTDKIDIRRTRYNSRSGICSAFYCLLLLQRPVSIIEEGLNSIPIDRFSTPANRKDRHHIFPRRVLRSVDVQPNRYNSICNICLLTAEENQIIGGRRPSSYLDEAAKRKRIFSKKMNRHLIPADQNSGLWDRSIRKGFNSFIRSREELICRSFEHEAGMRLFRRES